MNPSSTDPSNVPVTPEPNVQQPVQAVPVTPANSPIVTPPASTTITPTNSQVISSISPPSEVGVVMKTDTPAAAATQPTGLGQFKSKKRSKWMKLGVISVIILALLGGGSAAAYYTVIVPNKPQNRLMSSVVDLAKHSQMKIKGTVEATGETAFKMDYNLAVNGDENQMQITGNVDISGSPVKYDVRYLEDDLFFKIDGLKSVSNLSGMFSSEAESALVSSVISSVDGQWITINKSFANQVSSTDSNCLADLSFKLSDQDIAKIKSAYIKHPLFTVKSSGTATVDGVETTKFEVTGSSNAESAAFINDLDTLNIVKSIRACSSSFGEAATDQEINTTSGNSTDQAFIYITNDKQIKKIELTSNEDSNTVNLSATFDYTSVTVEKPEGAKSVMDLYGSLLGGLDPGLISSSLMGDETTAQNTERTTDIKALYGQIEAYYSQNSKYPTLANLNDSTWRAANMKGLDQEVLKDPNGSAYTLSSSPAENVYAYDVQKTSGGTCDNNTDDCVTYTLTATLDGGGTFTKSNLN